jgi:Ni,Fe-hydrogenase maturation factor
MKRMLFIAVGNPERRDDGVAHWVLERLGSGGNHDTRYVLQLTPEVAADIARYEAVVFIDADAASALPCMEEARECSPLALTHASSPGEVVALARALFGFEGHAWVFRIPVRDLSFGTGISPKAMASAAQAMAALESLIGGE